MNEEEKKALEAKALADKGGAQGKEGEATPDANDALLALLESKDKDIERITEERNNYRKGMLKAKGKTSDEGDEPELSIAEQVSLAVKEALLDSAITTAQKEKDEIVKKALRENAELKTAIKNRTGMNPTGQGAASDTEALKPKDNFLSDEQIKHFKAQGKDDAWIERYKKTVMGNRGFF